MEKKQTYDSILQHNENNVKERIAKGQYDNAKEALRLKAQEVEQSGLDNDSKIAFRKWTEEKEKKINNLAEQELDYKKLKEQHDNADAEGKLAIEKQLANLQEKFMQ